MAEYVKTYSCPECGTEAMGRGHLCHPNREGTPYTCEHCKKKTDDPRHACSALTKNIEYICNKCGRLAVYASLLCKPQPIDTD